ncbi:nicotinate phosphoribosyltransferase [Vulcanisaeta souniana]|uniref:nicotinate phosphoribosyltransferase n=1 Tax=Vulcanisaeta souniana JCM 11219 TaxID=1293586 RepID=A0A830EK47_9CREN|nr:nicotinate phosphoribosyltransferase [Vulcanisaeta souniana]BDR92644.1 nicotinate phosphoribosyltransferase [Vulcanisaeta souniana JCM 11219]GGI84684.1 nicotinate phosphoribosyltransferase [Vulcanisaeta souniana JCM 11219]
MDRLFYVAKDEEILNGETTDIYFMRTVDVLKAAGLDRVRVRAEFHVVNLPRNYGWAVFAGLKEVVNLTVAKELPITIYAMPEGTLFRANEPLMVVEGNYMDFAVYETAFLGILRHYSSVATKAARIKKLAGDRACLFFGARVVHPAIQPMVDRASYIGGCDGVAGVVGAKLLGVKPSGTMPHALMIVFRHATGDHTLAWVWFDKVMPNDVPRIVLADTFLDEREESMIAAKLLGNRLYGVRLDTPSSRRGNMEAIVREVRWTLDLAGYRNVKIVVSGGVDEEEVVRLRGIADMFGVGTSIAFPPSVDVSMDIVEAYDEKSGRWVPITKRGKLPGFKQVYRCRGTLNDQVIPWDSEPATCPDGSRPVPLLRKFVDNGKPIEALPSDHEIRNYVLDQLRYAEI